MYGIAEPVSRLIDEFVKLPGVGPKTAQRLAYFVLRLPDEEARRLAEAIVQVKERVVLCSVCFNVTERNPCAICANPARDHGKICVVEEPLDVTALERTGIYRGVYHVLHGALNPQDGIGPDDIKVKTQGGANEIQFFFPTTSPIYKDDKEVTFHSVIGRMTVENKFQLKNMTRNKKLELY